MFDPVIRSVVINASALQVWQALTDPVQMKVWMSQPDMEVVTTWKEGDSFIISVPWYKSRMENKGTLLVFRPLAAFQYTHLSSLSRLPDSPENYTAIGFMLAPSGQDTIVTLTLDNFPTEAIYRHLAYYWTVALSLLKRFVEGESLPA